jgi:hypothetical protein
MTLVYNAKQVEKLIMNDQAMWKEGVLGCRKELFQH